MRVILFLLSAIVVMVQPVQAFANTKEVIKVKSKRGVSIPFLLTVPDNPKASVILFIGGNGLLKLSSSGDIREGKNIFLAREYKKFADQGFMVALVDVASDMKESKGTFRISDDHANDIFAVIDYLRKKADIPIWLVGTSMGSFSAASVGIKKQQLVAGIVLTSSVTRPAEEKSLKKLTAKLPDGVASLNLNKFKKPALIVSHAEDNCKASPPADAAKLKSKLSNSPRVEVVLLKGGKARKSGECEGLAKHGFYGIEMDAVKAIADFIKK